MIHAPLYELPFAESVYDVPSTDGVIAKAYDFGGSGQPFVIAHATGLHARTYAPLVARLRSQFHCYAIDARAQGEAGSPTNGNYLWTGITEDFANGLDALGLSGRGDVFGMGHSQGGYSILSGALARKGTFAAAFGFEPVIFPESIVGRNTDNRMAIGARKRRNDFASKRDAYDTFRAKPPFSGIDDDCLRAYVEYGFEETTNNDGTQSARLKCNPEEEALLFENATNDLHARLPEIEFPVTIGCGEFTLDHFHNVTKDQARQLPNGRLQLFPGRSHFGLLERTDDMANEIVSMFQLMATK